MDAWLQWPHRVEFLVKLDIPRDWKTFRMPPALDSRLQELLDLQDEKGKLTRAERREAEALVEPSEMLSLMKLRAKLAAKSSGECFKKSDVQNSRTSTSNGFSAYH